MANCIRCGKELKGKQKRWCSLRCSKLGLKQEYKKRNKEKVLAYNKKYKNEFPRKHCLYDFIDDLCYFCRAEKNLEWHHVTYQPPRFIRLCKFCHKRLHVVIKHYKLNPF